MGEPLANYKRVVNAVRRITSPAPDGLGISQRSVVVSTVGLAPAIRKPADEGLFVRRMEARGVACTVRDTRGQEIAAACGQLAAEA